ncbi:MAG: crossover junction endodeoxyribonuclease RuvC [Gemmatimonadota bacterium]|nr:crossover junction endodeoxyribonuclease RuvC [Gemmatimonadota bacterium]MDQ3605120.1 crossover junction endodeoxyribonuclease RuvC [Gemmatimonadota bacterium]
MIVLGIDPGTAVTGYGVVSRDAEGNMTLRECGVVRSGAGDELAERLREIYEGVVEVIARAAPSAVAVEGVFYGKNPRTTAILGHARGTILLAAALRGLPVSEYPPAEVKSAVAGTGRATKEQVGLMVARLLKLREPPRPHDAADAVAVAICHCFRGVGVLARPSARFSLRSLAESRGVL